MDCVSGRRYAVSPEIVAALDGVGGKPGVAPLSPALMRRMVAEGLIDQGRGTAWPWSAWMPEAAFFHFGTQATRIEDDGGRRDRQLRAQAKVQPPPSPVKKLRGRRVALPDAVPLGEFSNTLLARRTWRNFSKRPISLADLATLLSLTFGVQHRGVVKGQGPVVLKTSPSAGARHPIEAYVLALNVEGLRAGVYHYNAGDHGLSTINIRLSRPKLVSLLGGQPYFKGAAAVVVMSAVFARSMWKYPSPRAYRSILIDAGHLGQTFCLTAAALQLAPFCTMAFRERELDKAIGIDGVREDAIYVVGVGSKSAAVVRPGRIRPRRAVKKIRR